MALDTFEVVEFPSEEVFENVAGFFGPKPILSSSDDCSNAGIEALRNKPVTDALGFNGREENDLLPEILAGSFPGPLTGLGDLSEGVENIEGGLVLGTVDGVLTELAVPTRFTGVIDWVFDLEALKLLVEARKSGGMHVSLLELEGLELTERVGGPIKESVELEPGLDE